MGRRNYLSYSVCVCAFVSISCRYQSFCLLCGTGGGGGAIVLMLPGLACIRIAIGRMDKHSKKTNCNGKRLNHSNGTARRKINDILKCFVFEFGQQEHHSLDLIFFVLRSVSFTQLML